MRARCDSVRMPRTREPADPEEHRVGQIIERYGEPPRPPIHDPLPEEITGGDGDQRDGEPGAEPEPAPRGHPRQEVADSRADEAGEDSWRRAERHQEEETPKAAE